MSTLAILIDGVDRTPQLQGQRGVSLSWRLGGRGEASFEVYSSDGSYIPECGHDVQWYNALGNKIWGGVIHGVQPTAVYKSTAAGVPVFTKCNAVTYEQQLDKRMVAIAVYEDKTCKQIIDDIFTSKLPEGGHVDINAWGDTVQAGVTLSRYVIDHARVSDILDDLAARSGYAWWVGRDRELYFVSRATSPGIYFAPFSITDAAPNVRELSCETSLEGYRNRQHIRVSYAAGNKASQTIIGDGVTVQWTLMNPNYPAQESLINYIESIKVLTGSPATERDGTWGTDGIDTDREFYFLQGGSYIRQEVTSPATPLTADEQLIVEWRQLGDDVMTVENGMQVAVRAIIEDTTGIYENLIDNSTEIDQVGHLAKAQAVLDAKSVLGTVIEGVTDLTGLYPGMVMDVAVSTPPITATVLVDSVEAEYISTDRFRYKFHASTAAYDDWIALWDRVLSDGSIGIIAGASSSQATTSGGEGDTPAAPGPPTSPVLVVNDFDTNFGLTTSWTAPDPLGSVVGYDREVQYYSSISPLTEQSDWIPLGSVGSEVVTADSGPWPRPVMNAYIRFRVRSYNSAGVSSDWVLSDLPLPDIFSSPPPTKPTACSLLVLESGDSFGLRTSWTPAVPNTGTVGYEREVRYYSDDAGAVPICDWIPLGAIYRALTITADSGFWPKPKAPDFYHMQFTFATDYLSLSFTKTGSTLHWDWGDGTTADDNTPSKYFSDSDPKTIDLTSDDGFGAVTSIDLSLMSLVFCPDFSQFSGVTYIALSNGTAIVRTSGTLPSFAVCPKLEALYADHNDFSGTLPSFADNAELITLDISNCTFSGTLPSFAACVDLQRIFAGDSSSWPTHTNAFTGSVAGSFATQKYQNTLWLNGNALTEAAVNQILADLVASLSIPGRVTCSVKLNGGTNAAPTGQGVTDKTTLIAAGWTVVTT